MSDFLRRFIAKAVDETFEDMLAKRPPATADDVKAMKEELAAAKASTGDDPTARIEALEKEVEKLKKKLSMTQGALQAATAQLVDGRRAAGEALATSRQASQVATSALATAEAAMLGIHDLEGKSAMEVVVPVVEAQKPKGKAKAKKKS